jgi:glyoxylase-like metal-dependent hydrolase (beta-lactamase superfamily II)
MKVVLGAVALLCFLTGFGQEGNVKLKFTRLSNDLYVYTNYKLFSAVQFPSNSMYLVTDEGVVLFDTPWDETQFQPLLDSIEKRHSRKVVMCVATHFHDDSAAGIGYYKNKGVKTYTSKQTFDLMKEDNRAEFTFEKDTVFNVGGKTFETYYPGKGHSPDNIVIWIKDEKILYGGCFVKSTENDDLGNLSDADVEAWDDSVLKVMKKYPKLLYVIPGHFGWSKGSKALRHTLKLVSAYKKE